ncbi:MAG: deoxyribose-phosphate aldolase [Lachnospiraceae bacterium]|nr:deoxyribose-phosphate aldolase [Lachnospiraceae bacterium]
MKMTKQEFASRINYTCTSPCATKEELDQLCEDAIKYGFGVVCVGNCHVKRLREKFGDKVTISTSVDYPLGRSTTAAKLAIAKEMVEAGTDHLDIMLNISMFLSGDYEYCERELTEIVKQSKAINPNVICKVLAEFCYFNYQQKVDLCKIIKKSGADAVKTHSGFGPGSFRIGDIFIIKEILGDDFRIKAAGDIEDAGTALAALQAGVYEIGNAAEDCMKMYNSFDDYIKYFE